MDKKKRPPAQKGEGTGGRTRRWLGGFGCEDRYLRLEALANCL